MSPLADILPPELTAIRAVGLLLAVADRRLRDLAPARASQRRRADPAADLARAADRRRDRDPGRAALGVLVRALERDADRRRRDLRDPRPLPARPAGAQPGLADHQRALGGARGAGLGAVPGRRPPGAVPRQDRRSWSPPTTRPTTSARCSTGSRPRSAASRPRSWSSTTARATAPSEVAARARRDRRPPRDQPRRRRGAADRLSPARRLGGDDRRHARRRRPAPARGDGATGRPVLDGEVALAHGSRVLGEAERNHPAREAGSSSSTGSSRSSPAPTSPTARTATAPCAPTSSPARPAPGAVPHLGVHDRGDQARDPGQGGAGDGRQPASGHSKKPAVVRYGMGFANAIVRTWLR